MEKQIQLVFRRIIFFSVREEELTWVFSFLSRPSKKKREVFELHALRERETCLERKNPSGIFFGGTFIPSLSPPNMRFFFFTFVYSFIPSSIFLSPLSHAYSDIPHESSLFFLHLITSFFFFTCTSSLFLPFYSHIFVSIFISLYLFFSIFMPHFSSSSSIL